MCDQRPTAHRRPRAGRASYRSRRPTATGPGDLSPRKSFRAPSHHSGVRPSAPKEMYLANGPPLGLCCSPSVTFTTSAECRRGWPYTYFSEFFMSSFRTCTIELIQPALQSCRKSCLPFRALQSKIAFFGALHGETAYSVHKM